MPLRTALDRSAARFADLKSELAFGDVWMLNTAATGTKVFNGMRAWAYVRAAAILEDAVREVLRELLGELNACGLRVDQVRPSLCCLLLDSDLRSLRDISAFEKLWKRRRLLFEGVNATSTAQFASEVLPLDGRTIRPHHFEVVWETFGFPGSPLPSPLHKVALVELADYRNDLAHGIADPEAVARLKSYNDVVRTVARAQDTSEHLWLSADDYISRKAYLR